MLEFTAAAGAFADEAAGALDVDFLLDEGGGPLGGAPGRPPLGGGPLGGPPGLVVFCLLINC